MLPAGQMLHAVRVVWSPPDVKDPVEHVLQLTTPRLDVCMYCSSEPHDVSVFTLPPSHECPAGQMSHAVREVWSPPEVKDPTAHVLQLAALAALKWLSILHGVCTLVPSQKLPAGQLSHAVCGVLAPAPEVNEPASHVSHPPFLRYWLSVQAEASQREARDRPSSSFLLPPSSTLIPAFVVPPVLF